MKLLHLILAVALFAVPSAGSGANRDEEENCRLFGAVIGRTAEISHYRADMVSYGRPQSQQDSGWSLAAYSEYYQGGLLPVPREPMVIRSQVPSHQDLTVFDATVELLTRMRPRIVIGHLRSASSGCSDVANPHPFPGQVDGRVFLAGHNGGIWSKDLDHLVEKLFFFPPQIQACPDDPVDSEFLVRNLYEYLARSPEPDFDAMHNWVSSVYRGLTRYWSAINLVISDGTKLWALRCCRTPDPYPLHYRSTDDLDCHVVSTEALPGHDWTALPNLVLAEFVPGAAPRLRTIPPRPPEF